MQSSVERARVAGKLATAQPGIAPPGAVGRSIAFVVLPHRLAVARMPPAALLHTELVGRMGRMR